MNRVIQALERVGLTNKNSESWEAWAANPPTRVEGFCTSASCTGMAWRPVKKDLGGAKPDHCPDCGHHLMYKRVRREMAE